MSHPREQRTPARGELGPFFQQALRTMNARLGETLPRVLAENDPEAIHDMRVAMRRLRVLLKIARPVYGRFLTDAARGELTGLHRATGTLRDEEVLVETIAALGVRDASYRAWCARRRPRERALRPAVIRAVRNESFLHARALVDAIALLPVKPKREKALRTFAVRTLAKAQKELARHKLASPEDAAALHALRIAYKRVRYTAEVFADVLPPRLKDVATEAAQFQKRLGEIHDLDVALMAVARSRGLRAPARAAATKALRAARSKQVAKLEAEQTEKTSGQGRREPAGDAPTPAASNPGRSAAPGAKKTPRMRKPPSVVRPRPRPRKTSEPTEGGAERGPTAP